jgi:hypothetical protein
MPDFQRAAIKAYETLRDHHITTLPIIPMEIIGSIPNVLVFAFTEAASFYGVGRAALFDILIDQNIDAITFSRTQNGIRRYIVAYNQRFPFDILQHALSVELGHIVLGHDDSMPEEEKRAEALCFAQHLLCPRPLVKTIQDAGAIPTVTTIGTMTGCYGRYIAGMRRTPGVQVPADLNRAVRDQLSDYVHAYLHCMALIGADDDSPEANFGTFMDGYEE